MDSLQRVVWIIQQVLSLLDRADEMDERLTLIEEITADHDVRIEDLELILDEMD